MSNAPSGGANHDVSAWAWLTGLGAALIIIFVAANAGTVPPVTSPADTAAVVAATTATHVNTDPWIETSDVSEMDGSRGVTVSTIAVGPVEGWLDTYTPSLVVRCAEHKTSVYVVTGMAASPELGSYNYYTTRLRYDDGAPATQRWQQSTDSKALFAQEPLAVARRIAKASRLRFQFTPFNASSVVVDFDVHELRTHLADVVAACR